MNYLFFIDQKLEGRLYLARCMQWNSSDYDEAVNMRGAIHLEYLYDALEFAATKGFPWRQVAAVVDLAEELISKTVVNGMCRVMILFSSQHKLVVRGNVSYID